MNKEWPDIAAQITEMLTSDSFQVWYPYPEGAIDALNLPCAIINEPELMSASGFTFSAQTIAYSGSISLLVKLIPDNQLRVYASDIAEITRIGRKLLASAYRHRALSQIGNLSLGEGRIARLSPNAEGESGEESSVYVGMLIPYIVQVQYGSND